MNWALEVLTLSVSDVDKALEFYTDRVGFTLDVDYQPRDGFRVVQLTPPGSACSIQLGAGLTDAAPGSARATYLAVTDAEAAHRELTSRGVAPGPLRHKKDADTWQGDWEPGLAPDRRDYASAFDFADPDGNTWVVQEIGYRPAA
ncbi:VOC family protein [Amycolatopsis sp. FDAARGOS 1241]|uniref:VOC family protein n=1 Tax=Amycolatopsis sp. FDAARGOS 1241 TaxID=2778070 RepID=UPI00194FEF03|nr:VOC family protein [Amycolatopsis sp. FDAARGOS 1241]QRP47784.1 VOC family protein [Amycolatopsis sp. FDAARGOS 1241]